MVTGCAAVTHHSIYIEFKPSNFAVYWGKKKKKKERGHCKVTWEVKEIAEKIVLQTYAIQLNKKFLKRLGKGCLRDKEQLWKSCLILAYGCALFLNCEIIAWGKLWEHYQSEAISKTPVDIILEKTFQQDFFSSKYFEEHFH